MANSNKNIIITPNIGSTTADPKIQFLGGNTSVNTDISMYVYPNSNGTLSFEGSAGQLFSITNDLSGSIFSVNDVSGIPSIEVFANGQISFAPYGGNVVFGSTSSISNPYFNSDINFTNAGVTRFISTPANNSLSLRFGTTGQSGYGTGSMALSVQGGGYVRVDYSGGGTYQYDPYGSYWHMGYSGIIFNNSGGNAAASPVTFQGVNYVNATTSFRAPIFYDSDNTAYYMDLNSTSRLNALQFAFGATSGPYFYYGNNQQNLYLRGSSGSDIGISFFDNSNTWRMQLYGSAAGYGFLTSNWGLWDLQKISTGKLYLNNQTTYYIDTNEIYYNRVYGVTDIRSPIFYDNNDTSFYLDPASTTTSLQIAGAIEQGNNIARPNIEWQASSASTGMVIFSLPGASGNYGMVHMVFDVYEYVAGKIATVIVGGHNWNGAWYETGCQVIGNLDKTVRLGFKDGKYCVVFGGSASTWTYGTIRLRKIHNGGFYNNAMDLGGAYTAAQTTTESFTAVTADLRQLRTPGTFQADGDIRTPIFYDSNNTNFYVDPASGSSIKRLFVDLTSVDPTEINGAALGNIYEVTTGWSAPGIGFGSGAGSHGAIGYNSGQMYFASENGSDNTLASRMTLTSAGILSVTGDVRAPIFYDSNDTAYYVDPSSTSDSAVRIRGGAYFGPNVSWAEYLYVGGNGRVGTSATVAVTNGNLHLDSKNGFSSYLNWYSQGNVYTGTSANLGLGSDSATQRLHVHGIGLATTDFRAPLFYDSNNTAYYLDPAASSVLNALTVEGSEVLTTNLNTVTGNGGWDLYGNGAYQKIYGDHSPFNNEVVHNVAFYRGSNWTLYGWNGSVWTNLGTVASLTDGRLGAIVLLRAYSEFIIDMGNTLGYCFMSAITFTHSTNGNSFNFFFEKSTSATYNTGTWTAITSQTGINSWPGGSSLKFSDVVGASYPSYTRIRIVPTWSHASNNIDFGGLTISSNYSSRNQLMTWDTAYNISTTGSFRAPIFYDTNNTAYYLDPASTSNLNTVIAADAFRSNRFEDLDGNFFFREGALSGVARHINLSDTDNDPASVSSDVGISWGARSDSLPYYMIWTSNYNNGITLHSRLRLGWHTGIEIGAATTYGGTRFFDNSPGISGAAELMSIGKSDSHVRVVNNLYSKIYYDIDNTAFYTDPATTSNLNTLNVGSIGWNTTIPQFGQRSILVNELTDLLYQADKRFTVTNGSNVLFDGDFGSNIAIPISTTRVININVAGQSGVPAAGITYPEGYFIVSFYYMTNLYSSITLRTRHNGTWITAAAPTDISTNSNYKVLQFSVSGANYLTDFELTVVTDATNQVWLSSLNYIGLRLTTTELELPYVSKYLNSNYLFGSFGVKNNTGGINNLLSGTASSYLSAIGGSVGIGNAAPGYKLDVTGTAYASADVRAPIFYDSNNTGYYVDPAGATNLFNLYIQGGVANPIASAQYYDAAIEVREFAFGGAQTDSWSYAPRIGFHWAGRTAAQIGMGSNARISMLNADASGFAQLQSSNFYSPIFYDIDNTAYYVDPATGTNLNGTFINNGGTAMTGGWNRNLLLQSQFPVVVFNSNNTKYSGIGVDYSDAASGFRFWVNGTSTDISGTGTIALSINTGNFVTAASSFRAPIFYDSNDTTYFIDPAGDTSIYVAGEINCSGYAVGAMQPGALSIGSISRDYSWEGSTWASDVRLGILANCAETWEFAVHDSGDSIMSMFRYNGTDQILMGRDIGWGTCYVQAAASFRAPIFYDSNNTAYYVDAASTSSLNGLTVAAQITGSIQYVTGGIAPNTDNYMNFRVMRNNNSSSTDGMYIGYGNAGGAAAMTRIFGGGATNGEMTKYADRTEEPGSFRAPIFYDVNNTAYYTDPASTSVLNALTVGGVSITPSRMIAMSILFG